MSSTLHSFLLIMVIALTTFLTRALPFILFPENKQPPKIITHLSKVLPCAVMGMLIVYCLKNVNITGSPYGLPELISIIVVVALHIWKRNTLLSIITGTVCYMLLIQFAFN